jgi:hypothetical protein
MRLHVYKIEYKPAGLPETSVNVAAANSEDAKEVLFEELGDVEIRQIGNVVQDVLVGNYRSPALPEDAVIGDGEAAPAPTTWDTAVAYVESKGYSEEAAMKIVNEVGAEKILEGRDEETPKTAVAPQPTPAEQPAAEQPPADVQTPAAQPPIQSGSESPDQVA